MDTSIIGGDVMGLTRKQKFVEDLCEAEFTKRGGNCEGCSFNHHEAWCHKGCEADLSDEQCDEIIEVLLDGSKKLTDTTEDLVNHPSHYTNGGMECIDEMILIFGIEATMHFCLLNAWKYRRRALDKNGQQDMDKSHWYINKYKELKGESA